MPSQGPWSKSLGLVIMPHDNINLCAHLSKTIEQKLENVLECMCIYLPFLDARRR